MLKDDQLWLRILIIFKISFTEIWISSINHTTEDLQCQEEIKWLLYVKLKLIKIWNEVSRGRIQAAKPYPVTHVQEADTNPMEVNLKNGSFT